MFHLLKLKVKVHICQLHPQRNLSYNGNVYDYFFVSNCIFRTFLTFCWCNIRYFLHVLLFVFIFVLTIIWFLLLHTNIIIFIIIIDFIFHTCKTHPSNLCLLNDPSDLSVMASTFAGYHFYELFFIFASCPPYFLAFFSLFFRCNYLDLTWK